MAIARIVQRTRERRRGRFAAMKCETLILNVVLQPAANGSLIAQVLIPEVLIEKPFFTRDHNCPDEAHRWDQRYEQPKIIQPH
jgi:hypothetical protein